MNTSTETEPILPAAEEVPSLIPARDSVAWRYSADARVMNASGYALLLQVAHPTVGAGVSEFSNFKADPWGRLLRTLDFTTAMVYGGPRIAAETCRRVREMHKAIKGVRPDGERYHALEPQAYAWVHATLAKAIVEGHRRFARPMSAEDQAIFWQEWRRMGRLLGVRYRDLPEEWAEFGPYYDAMVRDVLEPTESVRDVLETMASPEAPPLPWLRPAMWRAARLPARRVLTLATVGLMDPVLREKLGLEWSRSQERELRMLGAASRAATPLMPRSAREFGPAYLKWRREQIERGDTASRPPAQPVAA